MKRKIISLVTLLLIFISASIPSFASSYVLPYPSAMPGNFSYKLHLLLEKVMQYWYYGSFGQFDYNLQESDKYLVEAKTLFEYQQYLLGYQALQKSNTYFLQTLPNLGQAKKEGKDISEKRNILHEASLRHKEVLEKMEEDTPTSFIWSPEKNPSSILPIHSLIQSAIHETNNDL